MDPSVAVTVPAVRLRRRYPRASYMMVFEHAPVTKWWYTLPHMKKEYGVYAAGAALIVLLVAGVWWKRNSSQLLPVSEPIATSSPEQTTTSSTPQVQPAPAAIVKPKPLPKEPASFSLVPGDTVTSWDFAGTRKDGGQLEAAVRADITRLKGLLNSGTYSNYELYVSIANQYEMLGDGGKEYEYLNYALAIDSTKTGLAWHNMGKLLERLGAYNSARVAYDHMIAAQFTSQYIRARLEFLQAHMPWDTDAIKQAEADLSTSVE